MIMDETAPRNSWIMGRVVNTLPYSNGAVRRVSVKTKTNTLDRPINKLLPAEACRVTNWTSKVDKRL